MSHVVAFSIYTKSVWDLSQTSVIPGTRHATTVRLDVFKYKGTEREIPHLMYD